MLKTTGKKFQNFRYNTNTWPGTALTFVDKLLDTIHLYNDIEPTQLSDELALNMVENAAPCSSGSLWPV